MHCYCTLILITFSAVCITHAYSVLMELQFYEASTCLIFSKFIASIGTTN